MHTTDATQTIKVIDTSALLASGKRALFAYPGAQVVLPVAVINELESKRTNGHLLGYQARTILRFLEELRKEHGVTLAQQAVPIDTNGTTLRIEINHIDTSALNIPTTMRGANDMRILAVAKNLQNENPDTTVTLISNDLPLRLTANIVAQVKAEELLLPRLHHGEYIGIHEEFVSEEHINALHDTGTCTLTRSNYPNLTAAEKTAGHLGLVLKSQNNPSVSVLATLNPQGATTIIPKRTETVQGMKLRGAEQKLAMAHLLNPQTSVISLGGKAGTGKTTLATLAGLELVNTSKEIQRIVIFRSLFAVAGQDLGFLPGTEEEKMNPWAGAVEDVLNAIYPNNPTQKERLKRDNTIEVLPITHIRGRTLSNALVIIDEAQNFDALTLLNIVTRLGVGSKVVLCWDAAQSDNLSVSPESGILNLVSLYVDDPHFAHITLQKSQRSPVSEKAARLIEEISCA